MSNPNYVLVKLDEPVGPDDAQKLAEHIVTTLAFSDVASAQPVRFVPPTFFGDEPKLIATGDEVSAGRPPAASESAPLYLQPQRRRR